MFHPRIIGSQTRQQLPIINIQDWSDDAITPDWIQIAKNAIAYGVNAYPSGFTLRWPADNYPVNIPLDQIGIQIPSGITIRMIGDGRDNTILTSVNPTLTAFAYLFTVSPGGSLIVEDMTLIGPANPGSSTASAIIHFGTSGFLKIRRVLTTGFTQPFQINNGATVQGLADEIEASDSGTGLLSAAVFLVADIQRFRARYCNFHDFGVVGSNQSHGFYIHNVVDADVSHCDFDNNRGIGFSVQLNNGVGTGANSSVNDCFFGVNAYQAIVTNQNTRTRINSCIMLCANRAITFQFDADVADCLINNPNAITGSVANIYFLATANVRIRDSSIIIPTTGQNAVGIAAAAPNSTLLVNDCLFTCNENQVIANNASGTSYVIVNCGYADSGIGHFTFNGPANGLPTLSNLNANTASQSVLAGSNDTRGTIQFNITASIASGTVILTVTFAKAYANTPVVFISNLATSQDVNSFEVTSLSTSGFSITTIGATGTGNGVKLGYFVVE